MSADMLALAEPILVFGLLVVFMHFQFRELRQRAEAREKAAREAAPEASSDDPPGHPPG